MFECITINRKTIDPEEKRIDIGFLLECLLFYKVVHLVVNDSGIWQLVKIFGADLLNDLLEDGVLVLHFEYDRMGIRSHTKAGKSFYSPISFSSPDHTAARALNKALRVAGMNKLASNAFHEKLLAKIHNVERGQDLLNAATSILSNQPFLEDAVTLAIRRYIPTYDEPVKFRCEREAEGFVIESNINFVFLNAVRKAYHQEQVTPGLLLSEVCQVEDHLSLAAAHLSEVATDDLGTELMRLRLSHLVRRAEKSEGKKSQFVELIVGESKSLRHAIDLNQANLRRVVEAIIASKKFKDWLVSQPPTSDIVVEYLRAATEPSIFERLPSKTARWIVFLGLGSLAETIIPGGWGVASGITLGAADEFLIERLLRKWKPSHFVNEHIKPLIREKE